MSRIEDRTKIILAQVFDISSDKINDESSIYTIGNWDSFRHMHMVLALENEFKIEFSQQQVVEVINYTKIINVLKELVEN